MDRQVKEETPPAPEFTRVVPPAPDVDSKRPRRSRDFDGVAQEVNVATGAVVWEWHSIEHVPLSESQSAPPTSATASYGYFRAEVGGLERF